jgi:hypothetical protein
MGRTHVDKRALRPATWLASSLLFAACMLPGAASAADYQLEDLTGVYARFFDRTRDLAADARVAAFKTEMNRKLPGFYDVARMPDMPAAIYDELIARSFTDFPALRDGFTRAAASFQSMLRPAIDSFVRSFPDFHHVGRIALVHSLGEMDGGTRTINGRNWLVFGADMMARMHASGNARAFFHHELFHVYHGQFFVECEAVWCALWMEGLATHVSAQLNPDASDADLLLTEPEPIRAAVDAHLTRAVCAIRARLDSMDSKDYAAFFFGNSRFEDLPPRSGYYLGLLAAKQAGKRHSLAELAHLDPVKARAVLETALAELANCP